MIATMAWLGCVDAGGDSSGVDSGSPLEAWAPTCTSIEDNPGVAFSKDLGATFLTEDEVARGDGCFEIVIPESAPDDVYGYCRRGIVYSSDAGCTWTTIREYEVSLELLAGGGSEAWLVRWDGTLERLRGGTVESVPLPVSELRSVDAWGTEGLSLVAADGAIWRSGDSGNTWTRGESTPPSDELSFDHIDADAPTSRFAVTDVWGMDGVPGLAWSSDGGATWADTVVEGGELVQESKIIDLVDSRSSAELWVSIHWLSMSMPTETDPMFGWSADGGRTLTLVTPPYADIDSGTVHPTDSGVITFVDPTGVIHRYDVSLPEESLDLTAARYVARTIAHAPRDPALTYLGIDNPEPPKD